MDPAVLHFTLSEWYKGSAPLSLYVIPWRSKRRGENVYEMRQGIKETSSVLVESDAKHFGPINHL